MESLEIIVFTNTPSAYATKRIIEECGNKKLRFKTIKYKDIDVSLSNTGYELMHMGNKIPSAGAIFLRGVGEDPVYSPLKLAIIKFYKRLNANIINYDSFLSWPTLDKTTQYLYLTENKLPVVESFTFGSPEALQNWVKDNYPIIAKDIIGSCGTGVFKIKSYEDLKTLEDNKYMNNVKIKTLMFQRFLTVGEDLRVIVLGGKIIGAMKRIAKSGEYLTNFSQGGSVEKYDIASDDSASKIALLVSKLFKLDYCGVDLMKNEKGEWVVLEVNRACQFQGFEKSTGINIASEIVEYTQKN